MGPPPEHPGPHWGEVGIHGVPRMREWDAVVVVEAEGLTGDEIRFVALPDASLLVEEGSEQDDLAPLAEAVEASVPAPYRADARRRDGNAWAVGVRSIEIVRLEEDVDGDEISLTVNEGGRALLVDGTRSFGSARSLERYAEQRFEAYVANASRLDEDLWEVMVAPL